jgi:hypothetical protein
MEVLRYIEVIAIIVAALAVTAAAVRTFLLSARLEKLSDRAYRTLEEEVQPTLAEVEQTARRIQDSLGKVDATLIPFANTARRIEKWTAAVATETLVATALGPALGKVTSWVSGVRRGVGGLLKRH